MIHGHAGTEPPSSGKPMQLHFSYETPSLGVRRNPGSAEFLADLRLRDEHHDAQGSAFAVGLASPATEWKRMPVPWAARFSGSTTEVSNRLPTIVDASHL